MGRSSATRIALVGVVVAAAFIVTGCRPEPLATPSGTPPTVKVPTPGPSVTPIETNLPDAGFAVPTSCEQIYSASMLAELQAANLPLNDPGVTMLSTENADLLDILDSGAPTLRCSWGRPSGSGLATKVTAVDPQQSAAIVAALPAAGFGCEPLGEGTLCLVEQRGVTLDDEVYTRGEAHYVGGGGLVTTAWIDFVPAGYAEDIVAMLWG